MASSFQAPIGLKKETWKKQGLKNPTSHSILIIDEMENEPLI